MSALYPLRFEPFFRRYIWGGRRLESMLGKQLGEGDDYAESWEVVDHGADQSVVRYGPLQGATLRELVVRHGAELLGRHAGLRQFPLLFKLLDCQRNLSLQVHPNDDQARQLNPPDLGKTEAWVVLHADPGSVIYAGLKRGFDRAAIERELHRGTIELCLHRFEPRVGDCVFIPAGTVHALGAGLVVAEIQQASDTTFRLFDWNRLDASGRARPLHITEALNVIDYEAGPISPQVPLPTPSAVVQRLVECDKFVLDRWRVAQPVDLGSDERFRIVAVIEGAVRVLEDPSGILVRRGETILLPAAGGPWHFEPEGEAVLLESHLP